MADGTNPNEVDIKTRGNLAYLWSGATIAFIGYVVYMWGAKMEILTLLIGFVTGTAATILAVYFGAPIASKKPDTNTPVTGDNTTVVNNPPLNNAADGGKVG